jgi:hypothetical protein
MWTEEEIKARVRRMEDHIGYLLTMNHMRGPDGDQALRDLHQWAEAKRRETARAKISNLMLGDQIARDRKAGW